MTTLWIPIMMAFEVVKRIVTIPFYPLAYLMRRKLRTSVIQEETLYIPQPGNLKRLLWCMLDDSINIEGIQIYKKDIEYCAYDKRSKLIERLPVGRFKEFMRAFHWGCLRNNCVNLSRIMSPGKMVKQKIVWGDDEARLSFYAVRTYPEKVKRPYLQFFIGEDLRVKAGWLTNGRFEMGVRRVVL